VRTVALWLVLDICHFRLGNTSMSCLAEQRF
jgi:hypothetical protein